MIDVVVLTAAFAAGLRYAGWWSVPILAACWGLWVGTARAPGARGAMAALLATGGWLALDALGGPLGALARTIGGIVRGSPILVIVLTVALPVGLAWSAATLGAATSRRRRT